MLSMTQVDLTCNRNEPRERDPHDQRRWLGLALRGAGSIGLDACLTCVARTATKKTVFAGLETGCPVQPSIPANLSYGQHGREFQPTTTRCGTTPVRDDDGPRASTDDVLIDSQPRTSALSLGTRGARQGCFVLSVSGAARSRSSPVFACAHSDFMVYMSRTIFFELYDTTHLLRGLEWEAYMSFTWNNTREPDAIYAIIGNGFDLECGLHTSYKSFLAFVNEQKYNNPKLHAPVSHRLDWQALREHSYWFKRFESTQIGNGWVDFENEIARVVATIERCMRNEDGSYEFMDDRLPWSRMSDFPILGDIYGSLDKDINTYRALVGELIDDLRSLTRGLETYLYDYVLPKAPKETDATRGLVKRLSSCGRAYVVSFNYTPTLENMLKSQGVDCEFCYVHGIAKDGSGKNGMVLGIDDRTVSSQVDMPVEFGPFKKYNQRIYKQTDSSYMTWLDEARASYQSVRNLSKTADDLLLSASNSAVVQQTLNLVNEMKERQRSKVLHREVIIFGHSIGITDKDILRSFITLPDTRTVVYHHDEKTFSDQVSNMTAILGTDEVIARTGGKNRSLEFRNQRELG